MKTTLQKTFSSDPEHLDITNPAHVVDDSETMEFTVNPVEIVRIILATPWHESNPCKKTKGEEEHPFKSGCSGVF